MAFNLARSPAGASTEVTVDASASRALNIAT
jgi:hypothetical protein